MSVNKIKEHWMHNDFGEVQVLSAGHFPDTVMIRILTGDLADDVVETPISELISDEDSLAALNALLGNLVASKG